jgi:hypothetical protein
MRATTKPAVDTDSEPDGHTSWNGELMPFWLPAGVTVQQIKVKNVEPKPR